MGDWEFRAVSGKSVFWACLAVCFAALLAWPDHTCAARVVRHLSVGPGAKRIAFTFGNAATLHLRGEIMVIRGEEPYDFLWTTRPPWLHHSVTVPLGWSPDGGLLVKALSCPAANVAAKQSEMRVWGPDKGFWRLPCGWGAVQ